MPRYPANFMEGIHQGSELSAQRVIALVQQFMRPASVLDMGSGSGAWLSQWRAAGVADILGVDGDYVEASRLAIPPESFKPVDLSQPLNLGRRFDLVSSLEVAEHLPESSAEIFMDSVTRHGDTILFSAAVPGQGGFHHVNEQWPSYWTDKFAARGYAAYDVLRPLIWNNRDIEWWYRQNCLIFATSDAAERHGLPSDAGAPLDVAHPEFVQREVSKTAWHVVNERARMALRESRFEAPLRRIRDATVRR